MTKSIPTPRSSRETCDYLRYESMPLAIYRELVAHLRQVDSVQTGLVPPEATPFDYRASQIGGLWLRYDDNVTQADRDRTRSILNYYTQRFGDWSDYSPSNEAIAAIESA